MLESNIGGAVGEQSMLRFHHVVVVVMRKAHVQPITRLARAAVADAVGENHVVARRVEQLSGSEQLTGKVARQKSAPGAGGSVEYQHRIAHSITCVALR